MYPIAIVGAGPGDPELLTVKAHHLIEPADVILHDNLISDAIMTINNYCKKIYVGRKFGDNTDQIERQLMINKLLCKLQQDGKKAVSYTHLRAHET